MTFISPCGNISDKPILSSGMGKAWSTVLTGKQRAALRRMANSIDTIYQIGKGGLSDDMLKGISDALEARELIKLRVLENSDLTARSAADSVSEKLGAEVVSVIGTKFVLYRRSRIEKNRKIVL